MPCCYVDCRHRGRGDSVKGCDVGATRVTSICPRDDELAAVADYPSEDGDHRASIESHVVIRGPTFFPNTTILCDYICSKRVTLLSSCISTIIQVHLNVNGILARGDIIMKYYQYLTSILINIHLMQTHFTVFTRFFISLAFVPGKTY